MVALSGARLVFGIFVACAYRPLGEFLLRLTERWRLTKRIAPRLRAAYDSLSEMVRTAPLLVGTLSAVIAWGLECLALHVIVHGLGASSMTWDASVFAYAASTIAGAIAMMPGGLGVTEIGMTALLQTLGQADMSASLATTATILVRIATLWFAVALGMAAIAI